MYAYYMFVCTCIKMHGHADIGFACVLVANIFDA